MFKFQSKYYLGMLKQLKLKYNCKIALGIVLNISLQKQGGQVIAYGYNNVWQLAQEKSFLEKELNSQL